MVGTGTGSSLCHCEQSEAIPVVYEIATPSARNDFLIAFAGERSFCSGVIIRERLREAKPLLNKILNSNF